VVSEPTGVGFRASGSLVERAEQALRAGPLPTMELARRVLGITGAPPAAAAAVFSLLGTDARFTVDAAGVWSVQAPRVASAASLLEEEWVVVDVETTGGAPERGHRVTEFAAVRVAGGEIVDRYSTLVNPGRRIPRMITDLTGITDAMVRDAPRFQDVAPRVVEAIEGRVFVAHNAAFDWRFVSHEMERACGSALDGRRLCTVRLARKLLPQLPSRSLDGLAEYFGLEIASRHRALDDAEATARVLLRFVEMLADREVFDWDAVQTLLEKRASRRKPRRTPRSMDSA
jgi:DNA polymerase III epsilon subunit family exonuclease